MGSVRAARRGGRKQACHFVIACHVSTCDCNGMSLQENHSMPQKKNFFFNSGLLLVVVNKKLLAEA